MQTVAQSQTCRHTTIRIDTEHPKQFIDLTSELEAFVAASAIQSALLNVQYRKLPSGEFSHSTQIALLSPQGDIQASTAVLGHADPALLAKLGQSTK